MFRWYPTVKNLVTSRPHAMVLAMALAVLVFVSGEPFGWSEDSPLPWDQAGHYRDASRVARSLVTADGDLMHHALFGPDLYPPGCSLLFGSWMIAAGDGLVALMTFGLILYVGTAVLLARDHLAAALVFLGSPLLGSLAPTLMVEPVAGLLLVFALRGYPRQIDGPWWRSCAPVAAFAALMSAVLLTKYNVGLPLAPAAVAAAIATRRWRHVVEVTLAAALALGLWACFLSVQEQGWDMFLRFAENRSNTPGLGPLARLRRYFEIYRTSLVPGLAVAVATLALALSGPWSLLRRYPEFTRHQMARLVFALLYTVVAMTALARHEYVLSRNLVGPALALFVALGLALKAYPPNRQVLATALLGVLLIAGLTSGGLHTRDRLADRFYPHRITELDELSRRLTARLDNQTRTRVVGSFNEFSPSWLKILNHRHTPRAWMGVDADYPLPRSRQSLSTTWSEAYGEIVDTWCHDGTDQVLAMEVLPTSPFYSNDYQCWNAWKVNFIQALRECPAFTLVEEDLLHAGIKFHVFKKAPASPNPTT